MNDAFQQLYDLLVIDRKFSSYSRSSTLHDRVKGLTGETKEIELAIANNDVTNLREELGDAMWALLSLMIVAEERGAFTARDCIEGATQKLKRRKPWIFTGERLSVEEELARFNAIKQQEKGRS